MQKETASGQSKLLGRQDNSSMSQLTITKELIDAFGVAVDNLVGIVEQNQLLPAEFSDRTIHTQAAPNFSDERLRELLRLDANVYILAKRIGISLPDLSEGKVGRDCTLVGHAPFCLWNIRHNGRFLERKLLANFEWEQSLVGLKEALKSLLEGDFIEDDKTLSAFDDKPVWDKAIRTLSFNGNPIKKYGNHPAKSQVAILDAFQESEWRHGINSPITDGKKMRDTLSKMNRSIDGLIFSALGDGKSIDWTPASCRTLL
jgi:hypothetical protein